MDEIYMGSRDRDPKEFSAEMRHGESVVEGNTKICVAIVRFK